MKKYYIEVSRNNEDSNYLMQSKWYDTEEEALDFVGCIDYFDESSYTMSLMCSEWDVESDNYTDIEFVRVLRA